LSDPAPSAANTAEALALSLRVLIAEDNRINRLMVCECLKRNGHIAIVAENGAEAVELFAAEDPDVVLLDIVMPVMDGLEAARRIRALPNGATIPLLFLSAVDDQPSKLASLKLADDFIAKPIEPKLLAAKLSAFFRQVHLQHQLQEQVKQTQSALHILQEENELGAYVLDRMLNSAFQTDDCVRYLNQAAVNFSGDLVLYSRSPAGHYIVLLADAIGHGIAAAFNVFPLMSIFTAMTRKGVGLDTMVRQMNLSLRNLMPVDRFVSAAVVSIDPATLTMELWNGGLPPILVLDAQGRTRHQFESTHLPLRLATDDEIDCTLIRHQLKRGEEVMLFSDGLIEANRESTQVGLERVQSLLHGETEDTRFDILAASLQPASGLVFHDDVSLISMRTSRMR